MKIPDLAAVTDIHHISQASSVDVSSRFQSNSFIDSTRRLLGNVPTFLSPFGWASANVGHHDLTKMPGQDTCSFAADIRLAIILY